MICSEVELGIGEDADGIMVLPDSAKVGQPFSSQAGLDDVILDFEVTPNRPDCLSLAGIAREVRALTGLDVNLPETQTETAVSDADAPAFAGIEIEDAAGCPRYVGRVLRGIQVAPSPAWLQQRLTAVGQRPINNVVDVTNLVMLETGQPLHAFDYDNVRGGELVVRLAKTGEKLHMLDGSSLELTDQQWLVADAKGPSSLAGVMGGEESEIKPTTTRVLLEAANWDGAQIRRTQTILKLRTEAGARFEKNLNPELALVAWQRAMHLLVETGGGKASSGVIDIYPVRGKHPAIHLTRQRVAQILGLDVSVERVRSVLESLGFGTRWIPPDKYVVNSPYWRTDISLPDDLIEEIGRIIGYDSLPSSVLTGAIPEPEVDRLGAVRELVRDVFVAAGGIEVVSYVTTSDELLAKAERSALTALPGIGLKTAKRIIVELKDKFVNYSNSDMPIENSPNNESYQDTYNALKSLGFNHNEINKCLGKLINKKNDFNTQDLIKESLKLLKNSK